MQSSVPGLSLRVLSMHSAAYCTALGRCINSFDTYLLASYSVRDSMPGAGDVAEKWLNLGPRHHGACNPEQKFHINYAIIFLIACGISNTNERRGLL